MNYGLIGTAYNTGIGHIAWGFAEQLDMKALLVDNKPYAMFPERFRNHRVTKVFDDADIDWLLDGIDVLFTIETPYRWDIYRKAHERGIKTVLMPMIEWLDRRRPELKDVDLFVCPSSYTERTMNDVGYRNTVFVPCEVPVDLSKFKPARKGKRPTFLHNAGHGGIGGRNGTKELLEAIPLVKADCRFIIRSQKELPPWDGDTRVTRIQGNVLNYWDLYEEGDYWIMPWKYGVGICGLQESLAAGMLPVVTDMEPFNFFLPKQLLITPASTIRKKLYAGQQELYCEQSPQLIAERIEALCKMEESWLKAWAADTAHDWSWDVWKPKYQSIFNNLCKEIL